MNYFITGIGTNVGKTIVAALLTEAWQADYWKPIQSGVIEGTDSEFIKSLISNQTTKIHPEAYLLNEPLSPHFAAKLDNVTIHLNDIKIPESSNTLIIEGAGGLLVPLNETHYVIDIASRFNCQIVVVVSNYLGCINHTLLTLNYLMTHKFNIKMIVFNGDFEKEVRDAIINFDINIPYIEIPQLNELSKKSVSDVAKKMLLFL